MELFIKLRAEQKKVEKLQAKVEKINNRIIEVGDINCCNFSSAVKMMHKIVLMFFQGNKKIRYQDAEDQIKFVESLLKGYPADRKKISSLF